MTGVRELAHAEMQERTLTAAREQLKTVGPAQLSLRAIALESSVWFHQPSTATLQAGMSSSHD